MGESLLKTIRVDSRHDNVRVANAVKSDLEQEHDYQLEFAPQGSERIVQMTILRHQYNSQLLNSYEFTLSRGLYDVYVTRVNKIDGTNIDLDINTRSKFKEPVMVGGKYRVRAKFVNSNSYGQKGVRVQIISDEIPIDSSTMYYMINKEGNEDIRYYIPFNNKKSIEFFVLGITADMFQLKVATPSFDIQIVE
ncbi:MAG: hypothetical protein LUG12_03320 [Erysipelotrichaceae bacterium]|nr:hypothetical protein [Erysipelotrichaceae bacterium]